jgi:hypothetical protein
VTIPFSHAPSGFAILAVYSGSYLSGAPCTNYYGSNAYDQNGIPGGDVSAATTFSLYLTECMEYTLVLFGSLGLNKTITITAPSGGNFYPNNTPPTNPDYNYTYLAVNDLSGNIDQINASADFTNLPVGNYCIYGLHYRSGGTPPPPIVNPSNYIGQPLAGIYGMDSCQSVSGNCKPVSVTCIDFPEADAGPDQTICYGSFADLTASGGESYVWSNNLGTSATVNTGTLLTTTTYNVTITNNIGCTATDQVTVNVDIVTANAGIDQSLCSGQSATLTASGGTSYLWSDGLGNTSIVSTPPLNATITYVVTVTNGNCTSTDQVTVNVGNVTANAGTDQSLCSGQSASLTASGGTSYLWSNGLGNMATVTTPPLITTITYSVTVTNGNCTATDQVTVNVGNVIANAGADQSLCSGQSATLTASGGTSYLWSDGLGNTSTVSTPPLTATITYVVTVTNGNCTATDQVTVNVGNVIANAGADQSLCSGQSATLTASGGTSYLWSDGLGNTSTVSTPPLTATITYVVTVTNGNCTATDQVTVNVGNVIANAGADQSLCSGQSATLTAGGGTSYQWSNGLGNMATVTTPPLITTITYSVTVTNGNCTDTDQVTVNVGNVIANAGADQSLCSGQSTTLTASGGTSYLWSNGLGNTAMVTTPFLNSTITYTVTVTNGNCTDTDQVTVNVGNISANAGVDQSICSEQSATLTASGGTSYQWSNGLGNMATVTTPPLITSITYSVTVTNGNCTDTDQVTVNVGNVIANAGADQSLCSGQSATLTASGGTGYQWSNGLGNTATVTTPTLNSTTTYTVTVTNGNCTASDQITVNVDNVNANAGTDQSLCTGQSATLTASGGTSYLWSNGLGNMATVTTPPLITTITYSVTVTSGNCTATDQVTVNVGNVTANAGTDQSLCTGQSATLTASGGTSYLWSNGLGNMATVTTPTLNTTITYSVTVTNGNCTASDQVTVNVGNIIANAGVDQSLCSGQSATLTASGGTSYLWSNGLGNMATVTTPPLNTSITYTVTVTNGNCTATDQITVNVGNINANAGEDKNICAGQTTTLIASGGNMYEWSNGLGNTAVVTTPSLSSTMSYTVTVTIGNCSATDAVNVTVTTVPANAGSDQTISSGSAADLTASGGGSYAWSNGLGTSAAVSTGPLTTTTTFTVTVTNNNCTATDQVTVNINNILATVSGLLETEVQDSIGNATVTATNINNNEVINATFVDTGVYLVNLPIGFDYKIEPSRNDNPLNGVTTWDIVLITKHILGITPLNSPYKIIAADVNASLSVTAFDLLAIRKMILQITDTFPNGTPSWVFVDHNYVFPNPTNPWFEAYPTVVNIDNLSTNVQADFIGVKLGDVNNSVLASQLLGEEERNMKGSLDLNVKDKAVAKNEVFTVDFSSRDFVAMGYQFTLNFNEASLEYAGFKPGALSVSEENFGVFNNAITTSWNGDTNLKGDAVLFSLNFKAKNAEQLSKVLTLGSRLTPAEAYSNTAELMDVNLAFSTGSVTNGNVFELYQNEPNPFSDFTTIGFNLPVSESAKLVVYNIEGRTVKVVEGNYSKGFNSVRLNKSELGAGGVFYYELSTSTGSSMKKMIVIE